MIYDVRNVLEYADNLWPEDELGYAGEDMDEYHIYSRWAVEELVAKLTANPEKPTLDVIFDYEMELTYYISIAQEELNDEKKVESRQEQGRIFSIARDAVERIGLIFV